MDITVLVSIGFHGRSSCDIISGEPWKQEGEL
jgi:hypothetical protein